MSKIPASKHKIDRRLGVNLWGRPGSPFNTRNFGPGQHGKQKGKPTDYGVQLKAKQKLKGHYGRVGERQFRRIYQEAIRRKGDSSENLIGLLECRLDTVVYRAKFGATVFAARQLVSHGHITVDGKRVNVPSAYVREGQVVAGALIIVHPIVEAGVGGCGRAARAGGNDFLFDGSAACQKGHQQKKEEGSRFHVSHSASFVKNLTHSHSVRDRVC